VLRVWYFPLLALSCALPWAAVRRLMAVPVRRVAVESWAVAYFSVMLYIVFLPMPVKPGTILALRDSVNLVPLRTIFGIVQDYPGLIVQQLVGNVMLFVPMGVFLPRLWPRVRTFGTAVAAAGSASVGIELTQLLLVLMFHSRRKVDVDDVMLNVMGACLGFVVWRGRQTFVRATSQGASEP
jgi:glycopeptide antibiotics resistance protein